MKSENEIFNAEVLMSQFRDVQELAKDNRVICKAVFTQITDSDEPYRIGDVAFIYVNDKEVEKINFSLDPGEKKSKTVEIDVTDMLTEQFNGIKFTTLVDNNVIS